MSKCPTYFLPKVGLFNLGGGKTEGQIPYMFYKYTSGSTSETS